MSKGLPRTTAGVLAFAALYALAWCTIRWAPVAHASADERTIEALARVCTAEGGWRTAETGDCAAIAYLLRRRARRLGTTTLRMARRYSSRHFDTTRTDRRAWIAGLTLAARRPRGWPRALPWARYRPRWLAIVEHVRAITDGHVPDPCPAGQAMHWGCEADDVRAHRAGWTRLDCGPTRNHFWALRGPS